jgi:2',3'-cyclic-nucleotide 2'-phosphodiesterase (5'-nucleotidase family)
MATRLPLRFVLLATASLAFACSGDDDDNGDDSTRRDAGRVERDAGESGNDAGPRDGGPRDGGPGGRDAGPERDGGVNQAQSIVFLHTNDEHSKLLGGSPNIDDYPTPSNMARIRGGIARRATVMQAIENEVNRLPGSPPVVRVGAGDIVMGSLFHLGNLQFGVDYALAGALQYDVLTLGNHEFDFGTDFLAGMLANGTLTDPLSLQFGPLQIPLVISNIRFSMSDNGDDALAAFYGGGQDQPMQRTYIREFEGVRVGFVGVVGLDAALVAPFKQPVNFSLAVDDTTTCTSNAECPGSVCIPPASDPLATTGSCALDPTGQDANVNFPALVADIAGAVAELRQQGVDLVVALSHSGINEREIGMLQAMNEPLESATRSEEIVLALGVDAALSAMSIPGIDLIVGGHSHTALQAPLTIANPGSGINTYIVQAGSYGRFVGKVRLDRAGADEPWVLDANFSGLDTVDGTTAAQSNLVIDGFIDAIVEGLEESPIAAAGDGLIFPGEQCDGTVLPNGGNCSPIIPGAVGGTLQCAANRQLDTSQCILAQVGKEVCGDSTIAGAEQCDGTTIPVNCQQLGYAGGTLGCHANCMFDFSACTPDFPSILEVVANFQLDVDETPVSFDPQTDQRGDLFLYPLGTTTFDVGETNESAESNLSNLVADANRFATNTLDPSRANDPVRVTIVANGVIRDGIYQGETGVLTLADLFRVLPLGVSPVENTPGHSLIDFNLTAAELKVVFELGLSLGRSSGAFWLGYSGARIEYDPSLPAFDPENPLTTGWVTRIDLVDPATTNPWDDTNAVYEGVALFDRANGGFPDIGRIIRVSTNAYVGLYATGFGICPRGDNGAPSPLCAPCTDNGQCIATGSTCDIAAGRCTGGTPVPFTIRTTVPTAVPGFTQELKEFLSLTTYVRRLPGDALPTEYDGAVPRRLCCVGNMCETDTACPPRPQ